MSRFDIVFRDFVDALEITLVIRTFAARDFRQNTLRFAPGVAGGHVSGFPNLLSGGELPHSIAPKTLGQQTSSCVFR